MAAHPALITDGRFEIEYHAEDEWITIAYADSVAELCGVFDDRFRVRDTQLDRIYSLGAAPASTP